ncbi:hypothetical protein [Enterovirga sp.]|jgi:hypothetical protein|uniref:hypothetical protein n=1 Tax=Enterovirga sp. TaxID=2026350 RepID=UPI002620E593|nr:hypothetical protein [Enterovirga sp.]MDB5591152.1 hypothetical protein [Enterovirga sp.]
MSRLPEVVVLMLGSALLTVGLAAAEARDGRAEQGAGPVIETRLQVSPAEKAQAVQAIAEQIVDGPACGRKVKVVYAGYGEGNRAPCPQPAR